MPKEVKDKIVETGIKDTKDKMFDVDVYYSIDIRNYWNVKKEDD